jgi:hypothetical protein
MENILSFRDFISSAQEEIEEDIEFTEQDIEAILEAVDLLEWEDVIDLYDDDELEFPEELEETLTRAGRQKKAITARRFARRRAVARQIALRRGSSPKKLMRRSILAARRLAYKQVLSGRQKTALTPQEKANFERRVTKMFRPYIGRATQKIYPKMRKVEQARLKKKMKSNTQGPSKKPRHKKHK